MRADFALAEATLRRIKNSAARQKLDGQIVECGSLRAPKPFDPPRAWGPSPAGHFWAQLRLRLNVVTQPSVTAGEIRPRSTQNRLDAHLRLIDVQVLFAAASRALGPRLENGLPDPEVLVYQIDCERGCQYCFPRGSVKSTEDPRRAQ